MLSFLRGSGPPVRTTNAANNPIFYEHGRSRLEFHAPNSPFLMTNAIPPTTPAQGASIMQPPLHFHIHQTEKFHVRSGTATFWKGSGADPWLMLSSEPGQPSTATVPPGTCHRFENASMTEDLVVDVQLDPEDYEAEQRFFRNFFGYLDDCRKANVEPTLFQLMVFLDSADTPLALSLPLVNNEWLGGWVSRLFLTVMAFWGRWLLGYQTSYSEYYEPGKSR
ncbi:hypothetical protein A1O1_01558 [Capronia coronata CBS 617.96]|uniref:Cupin 2 conserved barrel domain-containing protein n=1 Tax=Capronia coronata CBS 617.96 TaxID=1182541 RepID=W9YU70_9EURO|nr:uncharacterized protein A1O1_01558 [Capronia coronata CBS 617.96]EXJ96432.1 hypothetical protein A1O1_01558 [Capronia coronata CBS 617.96]